MLPSRPPPPVLSPVSSRHHAQPPRSPPARGPQGGLDRCWSHPEPLQARASPPLLHRHPNSMPTSPHLLPRPSPCPAPHGPCEAPARGPLPGHRTCLCLSRTRGSSQGHSPGDTALLPPPRRWPRPSAVAPRPCGWMPTDGPAPAPARSLLPLPAWSAGVRPGALTGSTDRRTGGSWTAAGTCPPCTGRCGGARPGRLSAHGGPGPGLSGLSAAVRRVHLPWELPSRPSRAHGSLSR